MTFNKPGIAALVPVVLALTALAGRPALAAERALAGVKIFSTTSAVLQKYGNPSQVIVGLPTLTAAGGASSTGTSGASPAAPGGAPGALPPLGGIVNSVLGGIPSELGGQGVPGGAAMPAASASSGTPGSSATGADNGEVTWVYDRPGGLGLEFTMSSDGRVIQIRATGSKGSVRTAKGIGLGDGYGKVIGKYGYPELQDQQGVILNAHYEEKAHATFQFYNQRLVGIIVAAVE